MRSAHVEMFPVDYEDAFYEAIVEGTGGVFALGLFDEEEEEEEGGGRERGRRGLTSLPALFSSSSTASPSPASSKLIAFVTAWLQNASHVDRTDASYLGLLEEAEEEARAEAAAAAAATATATTGTAGTTTAVALPLPPPPPPPPPLGPGGNLLGPAPSKPTAVYILTLGVSERHRGKGIGKLLVKAVAERAAAAIRVSFSLASSSSPKAAAAAAPAAAAAALVYLHVATFNSSAVSLYASCGFSRLSTFPDFYSISSGRQPDPERTLYDAHLFAMKIVLSPSSSSSSSEIEGERGVGGGGSAPWPFPRPPPPPLLPLSSAPTPGPALPPLPPAAVALAGVLYWLSSLATSLARVAFGAAKKEEDEAQTIPTMTMTRVEEERAPSPPWLSRLFRRK